MLLKSINLSRKKQNNQNCSKVVRINYLKDLKSKMFMITKRFGFLIMFRKLSFVLLVAEEGEIFLLTLLITHPVIQVRGFQCCYAKRYIYTKYKILLHYGNIA